VLDRAVLDRAVLDRAVLDRAVGGQSTANGRRARNQRGVLRRYARGAAVARAGFREIVGRQAGDRIRAPGKVEEKVAADEAIDVAILTKPRADKLVRAAKLVGGTTAVLAGVPIGLAVKKSGAPHPDISSVEAVKRTPLDAKSIAYVDPASGSTSGIFLAQALEKLGIAAELKSKVRLVSPSAGQSSPRVGEIVSEVTLRSGYSRSAS